MSTQLLWGDVYLYVYVCVFEEGESRMRLQNNNYLTGYYESSVKYYTKKSHPARQLIFPYLYPSMLIFPYLYPTPRFEMFDSSKWR